MVTIHWKTKENLEHRFRICKAYLVPGRALNLYRKNVEKLLSPFLSFYKLLSFCSLYACFHYSYKIKCSSFCKNILIYFKVYNFIFLNNENYGHYHGKNGIFLDKENVIFTYRGAKTNLIKIAAKRRFEIIFELLIKARTKPSLRKVHLKESSQFREPFGSSKISVAKIARNFPTPVWLHRVFTYTFSQA